MRETIWFVIKNALFGWFKFTSYFAGPVPRKWIGMRLWKETLSLVPVLILVVGGMIALHRPTSEIQAIVIAILVFWNFYLGVRTDFIRDDDVLEEE